MEGLIFAAVLLFAVIRSLWRGLRWLLQRTERGIAMEQAKRSVPSQSQAPRQQDIVRRREEPEATREPLKPRQQRPDVPVGREPSLDAPPIEEALLRPDRQELLRAIIWQEALAPPVSRRQRRSV